MAFTSKSDRVLVNTALPTYSMTAEELAILALPGLTGWWEVDNGLTQRSGFRLRDKLEGLTATVLNMVTPLVVTGSHGKPALQMGYGKTAFTGTERGAIQLPTKPLLGASGFTVFSVTRVPTVASAESATLGGYVWGAKGPSVNATPKMIISGSTGRPNFSAGGVVITNPAGFDARTGNWHVMRCVFNGATDQISIAVDRARATGTASGATTDIDTSIIRSQAPVVGGFLNTSAVLSSPFYGQFSAILTFDLGTLATDQLAAVESYLATKYGATLV